MDLIEGWNCSVTFYMNNAINYVFVTFSYLNFVLFYQLCVCDIFLSILCFLCLILLCFVYLGVLLWNKNPTSKMNCYSLQQNAFAACEEMRGSVTITDQKEPLICPKPRRVGVLSNVPMRQFRFHFK